MPSSLVPRRPLALAVFVSLLAFGASSSGAQPPPAASPQPTVPPSPTPSPTAPPAPAASQTETPPSGGTFPGDEGERPKPVEERLLPRLNVFFPQGDLDLKVSRLIKKTFFQGQVKYNFVKGDIAAFLRYRYYGFQRTTQFTVFDTIEFQGVQRFSNDFDRVRGALLLMQWPQSYQRRGFSLVELDRISSNKQENFRSLQFGSTNTYVRMGYQIGTPEDERSNAIVGETRARVEQLFTAFREIGPDGAGLTTAATYSFPYGRGDFDYVKLEAEALKRFDVTENTFLIGRLHAGSFAHKARRNLSQLPPGFDQLDLYTIPRGEYFYLDGRDNLRGLSTSTPGTEELHSTWEYFIPWFINAHHDFLHLDWQNWYWILYAGAGNAGFDRRIYTDLHSYIPDAGIGFESSFQLRKYNFFIDGIVARALKGSGGLEARISVKSYR